MCFWTFSIVIDAQTRRFGSGPEDASSLLSKRFVCVIVTMEKVQKHVSDISHVTPLSKNYSVQCYTLLKYYIRRT
jgi:hypothetical protein